MDEKENQAVHQIQDFLKALSELKSVTILEMTSEAKEAYDCFEEEIERQIANENLGIGEGYCAQLPNLVARLSCLHHFSRMKPSEIRSYSDSVLTVEKQDVERAISYAWKAWHWFEKVIEMMKAGSGGTTRLGHPVDSAIMNILSHGKETHVKAISGKLEKMGINVCPATIYNRLKKLKKTGRITSPRFGHYKTATKEEQRAK